MRIDPKRVEARTVAHRFRGWSRILSANHAATPIGAGFGTSRFSSPSQTFRVLYAAEHFSTAFAEAIVRDRFEGRRDRYLYRKSLEAVVATAVHTKTPVELIDLTDGGAYELGVDTDAKGARSHRQGQEFAETLHQETTVDGILFSSRLTGGQCVAIFDRAFEKLDASPAVDLFQLAALGDELARLGIVVRKARKIP